MANCGPFSPQLTKLSLIPARGMDSSTADIDFPLIALYPEAEF
jgi:hypothetical protein